MTSPSPLLIEQKFTELAEKVLGIATPKERLSEIRWQLQERLQKRGVSEESFFSELESLSPSEQARALAPLFAVSETYFLRHRSFFAYLEESLFEKLARTAEEEARPLAILSAGCATGEEPYSIACLFEELPCAKRVPLSLSACDCNPLVLEQAEDKYFSEWSFRGVPDLFKKRYFKKENGKYRLTDSLTATPQFFYFNLAGSSLSEKFPAHFDCILCCNLLMYFRKERAQQVLFQLLSSLRPGGWLIVSPSETDLPLQASLHTTWDAGSFFFQKNREPRLK